MLYPIQNDIRNRLDLSGIWDFKIDPDHIGEDKGWFNQLEHPRPIAVPGSWNEQYADLFNYFDLAWYFRRTFIPANWRGQQVFIRVGSANYWSVVYLNGIRLGTHEGGHLPFAFEITELVRWNAENTIAIAVENVLQPTRVPSGNLSGSPGSSTTPSPNFDFFPYSGIHRPVLLYSTPKNHIHDVTVVSGITGNDGVLEIRVQLSTLSDTLGNLTLRGQPHAVDAELVFHEGFAETTLMVPNARFWSHVDPYLYELTIDVGTDRYTLPVGIRTISVQDGKIVLNGQPVFLKGFGRHEDFPASGRGLNQPLMVKDYGIMRWLGANSYRTTHYPYSEEEMQLADREGFLIIDEIPAVNLRFDNESEMDERMRLCCQQINALVARDKNHPSVIMWSVANEPQPPDVPSKSVYGGQNATIDSINKQGKSFLDALIRYTRQQDSTRLVTFASVIGTPLEWHSECDLVSMNRYWGWYIYGGDLKRAAHMFDQELETTWDFHHKPILLSEFGAESISGMHGNPPLMWTEEYQADLIRTYLELGTSKSYVVGMHVWCFADFASVQGVMRAGGLNLKGILTRTREPKMSASVLREFWK